MLSRSVHRGCCSLSRCETVAELPSQLRAGADVLVGMFAGALAAVSSHPADVLLTRLCGTAGGASSMGALTECVIAEGLGEQLAYLRTIGWASSFAGLGPRVTMITGVSALQFAIYGELRHRFRCAQRTPAHGSGSSNKKAR